MTSAQIHDFFEILSHDNPEPTTELTYTNAFTLLVAVVLSAQATDKGVNKATDKLFPVVDSPQKMLALGEDGLKDYIKTIGLFNSKAKNIIKLSEALLAIHAGEVPKTREELEALPGVGRKTANVILNTLYGEHTIAVDTHVFRVSNRTGLAPGKDVVAVENALDKRVPKEFKQHAHHWIILHGRYICKAQKPRCSDCLVVAQCQFKDKVFRKE